MFQIRRSCLVLLGFENDDGSPDLPDQQPVLALSPRSLREQTLNKR